LGTIHLTYLSQITIITNFIEFYPVQSWSLGRSNNREFQAATHSTKDGPKESIDLQKKKKKIEAMTSLGLMTSLVLGKFEAQSSGIL
jgi:hypothetical protein